MSLKDKIITVTWNGSEYKVNRPSWYGDDVIPIGALKAWLESHCIEYPDLIQVKPSYYADVAQNELIEVLLAELNELGGAQ